MDNSSNNMETEKEIIKRILLIHDTNKLVKKEDNLDEFAKMIFNYKHNIDDKVKFKSPDDRKDSPHHHNNRLD